MKILNIARHAVLASLILTSVPLLRHFIKDKPHHEWVVHLHILFGLVFIVLAVVSTILAKKAKKRQASK